MLHNVLIKSCLVHFLLLYLPICPSSDCCWMLSDAHRFIQSISLWGCRTTKISVSRITSIPTRHQHLLASYGAGPLTVMSCRCLSIGGTTPNQSLRAFISSGRAHCMSCQNAQAPLPGSFLLQLSRPGQALVRAISPCGGVAASRVAWAW